MKWFHRIAQGFSPHGGWPLWIGETQLRRSDIFIDNPSINKRQLRRSGISGRVVSRQIFKRSNAGSGCRSDVAPTELGAICLARCYKDVAPTELDAICLARCYKDVAPTELEAIYLPRCYKDVAPTELKKGFLRSSQT